MIVSTLVSSVALAGPSILLAEAALSFPRLTDSHGSAAKRSATDQNSWWRNQSQVGRRHAVVETALRDMGKLHHIPSSKEWVKSIVHSASQGLVDIPMNEKNENHFRWAPSASVATYPHRSLSDVKPGMIIQMSWFYPDGRLFPHTAIVVRAEGSGLVWADCGWQNRGRVAEHRVLDSYFKKAVGERYTVYEVV